MGKRFLFAIVSMVAVSITTITLSYDPETYFKLVSAIVAVYTLGQTYTDTKGGGKNVG